MKISEELISVLCDPEGIVCIAGSDEDRKILQEAIGKVKELEHELASLKQENHCKFCPFPKGIRPGICQVIDCKWLETKAAAEGKDGAY